MRYAQTMAFTTLVFFSLFNAFNARFDERSAFVGLFSNKWLWGAVLLLLVLQAARDLRSIFCSRRFRQCRWARAIGCGVRRLDLGALAARLKQACCMDDHSKVVRA
jgi:magnesium-transporting ATPase (P-type)